MFSGSILAIDVAKRSGVAEGAPGTTPRLESINFSREHDDYPDIFGRACRWMTRRCECDLGPPDILSLEGVIPQFDKTLQAGLWGIFAGIANAHGARVIEAPVQTWRAFVLGNGKLSKIEAKSRAMEVCRALGWGGPELDHDSAEAGCQWLYACSQVAPRALPRLPLLMRGAA
jgi:hypothetical protein